MRVAIYARYSSENQSEKSIDDQVRVCKKYIDDHGMTNEEKHIYTDEAISGSIVNRPGLQALEKAAENKEFEAVAVDDLSRLSRSSHQMLTLVLKFKYHQITIISVSDGIVSDDENSKLGIHLRGIMNELYLDDLKKKTMRGLEGQKIRGFSAGENVYGYYTQPVGELKLNRKGLRKYEGMVHKIKPEEAEIIKRIYEEFNNGKSIRKIVQALNEDKTPTKKGLFGGWNSSSVSRILKNEKYTGLWTWRLYKNVRDPMTGKIRKLNRPKEEQMPIFREDLKIIEKDIWEKAQKRWEEVKGAYPVRKNFKSVKQKSYVQSNPCHLFAGLMKCQCCGGAIVLVSGKGSGYYGCYNSRRKTCNNTLLVSRKSLEEVILLDLKEKLLTAENLQYIYKKVEVLVAKGLNDVPEQIKKRKSQNDRLILEIQNYINYIKMGNFSDAISKALKSAEEKSNNLTEEINSLEFQKKNTFEAPEKEWISHRLEKLRETLNKNTTSSALALKELIGEMKLEPISTEKSNFSYTIRSGEIKTKPH